MELVELKSRYFFHDKKRYRQRQWTNVQQTVLFTQDELTGIFIYWSLGIIEPTSHLWHQCYKEYNPFQNPIWTLEEAIKKVQELGIPTKKVKIEEKYFKKNLKPEDLL